MKFTSENIDDILIGIIASFSKSTQISILEDKKLQDNIKTVLKTHSIEELLGIKEGTLDKYSQAIVNRALIIHFAIHASENNEKINLNRIWNLIYRSLVNLEEADVISSIGSQGFLAVPLFRIEKANGKFYLLRLHIWDSDLDKYIDKKKTEDLSIHTHQFHANSWIISGEIFNTRYFVEESIKPTNFNLFEIEWNKSENKVIKKSSVAKNTERFVDVKVLAEENYTSGEYYEIRAGNFHKSTVRKEHPTSSTLFLFSSTKSRVTESKVLGPSKIKESKINRKVFINPKPFLMKIKSQMENI